MTKTSTFIRWFNEISLPTSRSSAARTPRSASCIATWRLPACACPTDSPSPPTAYRHFLRASGLEADDCRLATTGLQPATSPIWPSAASPSARRSSPLRCPPICRTRSLRPTSSSATGPSVDVAVRSSATAEDLPDASFAGQQETYLNVRGHAALLDACRRSFASLFTDRAISYRADKGFDQLPIALSIGVQRMVRSDLATSGVMFTLDTESGFRDVVLINALVRARRAHRAGLGDAGRVLRVQADAQAGLPADPAEDRSAAKEFKLVYDEGGSRGGEDRAGGAGRSRALRDERRGDPHAGALGVRDRGPLQPRAAAAPRRWTSSGRRTAAPASCSSCRRGRKRCMRGSRCSTLEQYRLRERGPCARDRPQRRQQDRRRAASASSRTPPTCASSSRRGARHRQDGSRLGADHEEGGRDRDQPRRPHLPRGDRQPRARRARDRRAPRPAPTRSRRPDGDGLVRRGRDGLRLRGRARRSTSSASICGASRGPRTKIMMNVGNPDEAFALSFLPNDGVGLARIEFIISTAIGVHPMALVRYAQLDGPRPGRRSIGSPPATTDKPRLLRRQARRGRRDDRRGVLSEGRHRPAERLQDERIRPAGRRRGASSRTRRIR